MEKITDKIKAGKILVSDGAWGTYLQKVGLRPGECPELWNLLRPDDVFNIAKSYIDAGSDMILTNSFGGSRFKLANYDLQDQVTEINRAAAAISRKAAGTDKHVLGSIGPTGKMLITGDVSEDELYEVFKEQAIALCTGGADAIVVETMTDLDEAKIAVRAAKENTEAEIICTMTFDKGENNEYKTMMGVAPSDMVEALISAGADIVGTNCGNGAEGMIDIVKEIKDTLPNAPVLVHANAGIPEYRDGQTVFPETPDKMAEFIEPLIRAGANIIGGCCGTSPEHIRKIVDIVRNQ